MIVSEKEFDFLRQYKALLKHHRIKENSHADVSKKTGLNADTLKRYYNGDIKHPSPLQMLQIAKSFDISPEFFFTKSSVEEYLTTQKAFTKLRFHFSKLPQDQQLSIAKFIFVMSAYLSTELAKEGSDNLDESSIIAVVLQKLETKAAEILGKQIANE